MAYENIVNNAKLAQDLELASYVNEIKSNPQKLQTF